VLAKKQLELKISLLAELLLESNDLELFRSNARRQAVELTAKDLKGLRRSLHKPPPEPSIYDVQRHGLGGWLGACQFAIFELVYCLGEDALPFIRRLAWGDYDWTQGNAIELLIRMAADGTCRSELISEIKLRFPKVRFEAQLYAIQPLLGYAKQSESMAEIFKELMEIDTFKNAFEELTLHGHSS